MLDWMTWILQAIVGLGLLNVWLLRSKSATAYRGGESKTLKEEFAAYGLPDAMFYIVGFLKITSAILLLVGLYYGPVVLPAAATVAVLMAGALSMHVKVSDPPSRSVPAALMLLMSLGICGLIYFG